MRRLWVLLLIVAGLGVPAATAYAHPEPGDVDGDEVRDERDNCPQTKNADQRDTDGDGRGDRCDSDADNDGVANSVPRLGGPDNCPLVSNPGQEPAPEDPRYGIACYVDTDGDGVIDPEDTCPTIANPDRRDWDFDGDGDVCDNDDDDDFVLDAVDNCPLAINPDQRDEDGDGIGAACDPDDRPTAPPPPPRPAASPPDLTAPSLGITVARTLRLRELGRSIVVEIRCSERCKLRAQLVVKRRRVAAGTAELGGAGTTYVFMRKLRRLRPARGTLRVTATDAAGNVRSASRRVKLRR